MVLVSGNVTMAPESLERAASFAPFGSAANIRIVGLMDLAANATPEINPPPHTAYWNNYSVDLRNFIQKLQRYVTTHQQRILVTRDMDNFRNRDYVPIQQRMTRLNFHFLIS
ncbi:cyclic pyranopterin monophosphate synthaseaccessory protein, partial [Striga asiatica]